MQCIIRDNAITSQCTALNPLYPSTPITQQHQQTQLTPSQEPRAALLPEERDELLRDRGTGLGRATEVAVRAYVRVCLRACERSKFPIPFTFHPTTPPTISPTNSRITGHFRATRANSSLFATARTSQKCLGGTRTRRGSSGSSIPCLCRFIRCVC
jgi:hypothetical protein